MKIKFFCDNNANIHSTRDSGWMEESQLGLDDGEWETLSEEDKFAFCKDSFEVDYWWESKE